MTDLLTHGPRATPVEQADRAGVDPGVPAGLDPAAPDAAGPGPAAADLAPFGVAAGFVDGYGAWQPLQPVTAELLAAEFAGQTPAGPVLIATPGRHHPGLVGTIQLESGDVYYADGFVGDSGYHHLTTPAGDRFLVLAAPEELPQPPRCYGFAVQLYAARTERSWGFGDFVDLAAIANQAAADGARVLLLSPIHAMSPVAHQTNSPYSPASRLWLNLLHVAPADVPGAEQVDLTDLVAAGRALNASRHIDRNRVWALKRTALERIWGAVRDDEPAEFTRWAARHGSALHQFATWFVLAETMPEGDWRTWPEPLRHPGNAAISAFAAGNADRVRFVMWCQWVADGQLAAAAGAGATLCVDQAVGFDASSADSWAYQDSLTFDFEIGCPPDPHNREGQRWGLPPFNPHALAEDDFAPFVEMIRAGLRHAGGLRIDHVMQLWRQFWVPVAGDAAAGAFVHYPVDALLAIIRIEAARAGAWIVGEDMGTVAPGVRETMAAIGMLGCRAAMRTDPAANPECSVGVSSTHDQATVAGLLTGSDADDMDRIGKAFDAEHIGRTRLDLAIRAGLEPAAFAPGSVALSAAADPAAVTAAVLTQYRRLSASPSRIVLATLDDAAGVTERPNMPGTVEQYPNWRIALPAPVPELLRTPLAQQLSAVLSAGRT